MASYLWSWHWAQPTVRLTNVNIVVRSVEDALIVPATAIVDGVVFRLTDDQRVERIEVKTGISSATSVQITEGLSQGDRVVSPVPDGLTDGARVRLTKTAG